MRINLSNVWKSALAAEGPVLVTGGPGSGKTTLALLKAQRLSRSLEPGQEVLFLSFSRAAVRQVLIGCKDILTSAERQRITVKTYHAFCIGILKSHGRLLTGKPPRILFPGPERLAKSQFDGDWKNEVGRLASKEGCYAFSKFAASAAELLVRSASVRELISSTYPVIILDEFQDTDDDQWSLAQQLAIGSTLIALADPDQRIFDYQADIDPQRLNQLRSALSPQEFDFGADNHRSLNTGILAFADAVMANDVLPLTSDVQQVPYFAKTREQTVHAAVIWLLSHLRKAGIESPSVAVLGRSNPYVGELSLILGKEHKLGNQPLKPVDHHLVWDAQLTSAAAQTVASVLEWPIREPSHAIGATLHAIAAFYDIKNSERPSASAQREARSYRDAAQRIWAGQVPRSSGAKAIKAAYETGVQLNGDPVADWRIARSVLQTSDKLREIFTAARYVRLFRATNEIGGRLAAQWAETGTYRNARTIVRRTLDLGRLQGIETEPRGVVLMTLHKSKGKEFDGVVIVEGQYSGVFFDDRREKPPYAATRRLVRVGITRARHHVIILRPNGASPLSGA